MPSSWRTRLHDRLVIGRAEEASDGGYDSEEGEELGEVVDGAGARGVVGERRHGVDDARRLSRELSFPRSRCPVETRGFFGWRLTEIVVQP